MSDPTQTQAPLGSLQDDDAWLCRYPAAPGGPDHALCRIEPGDYHERLQRVEPRSLDVIVTSPPYNLGKDYGGSDTSRDRRDPGAYLDWVYRLGERMKWLLSSEGSFFLNVGSPPSNPQHAQQVAAHVAAGGDFEVQNIFHWVKSISIDDEHSYGHYQPINSPRYLNGCHEYVFHLTRSGDVPLDRLAIGVPYADPSNTRRWKGGEGNLRCRGNVWFIPYETIQRRERDRPHPATFPVELARLCILLHAGRDRWCRVLDPFLGSGSTAVACAQLGVDCLGTDLNPDFCAFARERVTRALLEASYGR